MSSKHFKALAMGLKDCKPERKGAALEAWKRAVKAVADACGGQNGRFDRGRFLEACGY